MTFVEGNLARDFKAQAEKPGVMKPDDYRRTLEKLLEDGRGFGKTEPVAAYLLRDLRIVKPGSKVTDVKVEPLYVVMDLKEWPNTYARSLAMQDIFTSYARRIVGEHDINAPDFQGPGLWTAKRKGFDGDYNLRDGTDDIYEPDPLAYRVCIDVDEAVTIPVQWGTYTVGAGGAIAVRAKDVEPLAEALQSIRDGRASVEDALYTENADGKKVAKFDVYGMEPGFRKDNYGPVILPKETQETLLAFASGKPGDDRSAPAGKRKTRRRP